ncbi:hypothetical protein LCGC14_2877950, partial [marine sediment metagenome]
MGEDTGTEGRDYKAAAWRKRASDELD